jgi:hypothetical protein
MPQPPLIFHLAILLFALWAFIETTASIYEGIVWLWRKLHGRH